ncbi:MAG: twin-arginine translocase subunit TatC, partial [Chloroflexi bacterium]|nr:twin-arginine translocase subunit TatC [Chloroflexota bacterium]
MESVDGVAVEDHEKIMDIWGHLKELRSHLFKALLALLITTGFSFAIAKQIIDLLAVPIGGTDRLISIEVTENVSVFMRVSLLSGFILGLPFVLYELLAFTFPGLNPGEKRWILISIPLATVLFIVGVAFAYLVMLPAALPFLVEFLGIRTTVRLSNYFNFVTSLLFWIGLSFEMPLVVFVLAKFKLVTAKALASQWRIAIVVISIVAAVVSPTVDPINMG